MNYLLKQLSEHDFVGFRSDLLNDKKGQRTGVNTKYTENTLMLSHWIGTTVQIRPEIRFDHSWDRKSYDQGKRKSQLTVASDLRLPFLRHGFDTVRRSQRLALCQGATLVVP